MTAAQRVQYRTINVPIEVVGTTATGKQLVVADAKNRYWRTLFSGLSIDLLTAAAAALAQLANLDPVTSGLTWGVVVVMILKSLLQAAVSFFARLRITPTIRVPIAPVVATEPLGLPSPATDAPPIQGVTMPAVPENIFSSVLADVEKVISPDVAQAVETVLGKILDAADTSVTAGGAQPTPSPIPVAAGSQELAVLLESIDAALSALNLALKLNFLIPQPYEGYVQDVVNALTTVKSWLA